MKVEEYQKQISAKGTDEVWRYGLTCRRMMWFCYVLMVILFFILQGITFFVALNANFNEQRAFLYAVIPVAGPLYCGGKLLLARSEAALVIVLVFVPWLFTLLCGLRYRSIYRKIRLAVNTMEPSRKKEGASPARRVSGAPDMAEARPAPVRSVAYVANDAVRTPIQPVAVPKPAQAVEASPAILRPAAFRPPVADADKPGEQSVAVNPQERSAVSSPMQPTPYKPQERPIAAKPEEQPAVTPPIQSISDKPHEQPAPYKPQDQTAYPTYKPKVPPLEPERVSPSAVSRTAIPASQAAEPVRPAMPQQPPVRPATPEQPPVYRTVQASSYTPAPRTSPDAGSSVRQPDNAAGLPPLKTASIQPGRIRSDQPPVQEDEAEKEYRKTLEDVLSILNRNQ